MAGLADDPIGVLEIFLVRRGEIAGSSKWTFAIPVHRAAVFVLDEVHDDGIESLPAAILEVLLRLFPAEADDQRLWHVAFDEKRSAALVHHMAMVRAKPERVGTNRKSNGDERQHAPTGSY